MIRNCLNLVAFLTVSSILALGAYANERRCPDYKGIFVDNRQRVGNSLPESSVSIQYWVIPARNTRSVDVNKTLENVIKNKYASRNKPRFSCNLELKTVSEWNSHAGLSGGGYFEDRVKPFQSCINHIDGTQFNPMGPHSGDARQHLSYGEDYASGSFQVV